MAKKKKTSPNQIAYNRQARHNYEIMETYEAGVSLLGSEVKSLRGGHVSFKDGYVDVRNGQAWLRGVHVAPYENAGPAGFGGHDPERPRRLLLHDYEIEQLEAKVSQKGLTVIPLKLYFSRGKIKLEIGVGRGLKRHDQRQQLKDRAIKREMERELS